MLSDSTLERKLSWLFIFFVMLLLVLLCAVAGVFYWYRVNTTPTTAGSEKVLVIQKGEAIKQISDKLEKQGIIRNSLAFRIYLRLNDPSPNIQAGTFKIRTGLTSEKILKILESGRVDKWVTIREGLRTEEIANLLAKEFSIKESDFLKFAKEGYMFPDTYLFPIDVTAEKAADLLRENFEKKVDLELQDQIKKEVLNLDQVITLASIVERESKSGAERAIIAGILLKRYQEGMLLEADATVQYALGYQESEKTWWKKTLTKDDLKVSSPYNTRRFSGLPSGPICNAGLESIKAVVYPTQTAYYFYLHGSDGKVHFAKTLDEHNTNVAKYL